MKASSGSGLWPRRISKARQATTRFAPPRAQLPPSWHYDFDVSKLAPSEATQDYVKAIDYEGSTALSYTPDSDG
jgi:hypothetical protein